MNRLGSFTGRTRSGHNVLATNLFESQSLGGLRKQSILDDDAGGIPDREVGSFRDISTVLSSSSRHAEVLR